MKQYKLFSPQLKKNLTRLRHAITQRGQLTSNIYQSLFVELISFILVLYLSRLAPTWNLSYIRSVQLLAGLWCTHFRTSLRAITLLIALQTGVFHGKTIILKIRQRQSLLLVVFDSLMYCSVLWKMANLVCDVQFLAVFDLALKMIFVEEL